MNDTPRISISISTHIQSYKILLLLVKIATLERERETDRQIDCDSDKDRQTDGYSILSSVVVGYALDYYRTSSLFIHTWHTKHRKGVNRV